MVLNALQLDPDRVWKGPWRWFSEELFDCCKPLPVVQQTGINMQEFACLARCNGAEVAAIFHTSSSLEDFRSHLRSASRSDSVHMVVAFHRKTLGQTGEGHYSPIGAYHAGRDLALVFDVARFKYPSYWCPVSLLWEATAPIDPSTGVSRGYFLLSASTEELNRVLCTASAFCSVDVSHATQICPPAQCQATDRHTSTPHNTTPESSIGMAIGCEAACSRHQQKR